MTELFIGDNLEIISSHLEEWRGKINLIYTDPPYNTGKSFTYNDNFFEKGDRHSAWLDFIRQRLLLAYEILSEDGCIFIAIGDDELYRLKNLCDEVFGEENFVNNFMWLHGKGKKDSWSRTLTENNLCYAKNKTKLKPFIEILKTNWAKKNIDNDPRGPWFSGSISFSEKRSNPAHKNFFKIVSPTGVVWERQWLCSKEKMEELLKDNRIYFGPAPDFKGVPREKIFNGKTEEIIPKNIIENVGTTRDAQNHLDKILGAKGVFDNPKPVALVEHLLKITCMKNDITVMDFFAGSGTTAEAVQNMNKDDKGSRKCILIQKDEKTFEMENGIPVPRKGCEQAFAAGFKSIADITKARISCLK